MRVKERLRSSVCARARECAPRSAHHHSHRHYSHSRAHVHVQSILPSSSSLSSWLYHSSNRDRERGLTASEEQRRAKGTGRERRILEERGAEYAEKLEEKAVIVAMARRVEGGNCSRRRMTIPLSPAYRMSEKDKEREREEFSRLAARARGKERAKGCSRGQEHKVTTREETRRRNEKQDTGRGLKASHQACRRRRRGLFVVALERERERRRQGRSLQVTTKRYSRRT